MKVAIPGVGSLGDDYPGVANVRWDGRLVLYRAFDRDINGNGNDNDGNGDNPPDPAKGSYTPYFIVTLQTTKSIPAGMQILQNLGESQNPNSTTIPLPKYLNPSITKTPIICSLEYNPSLPHTKTISPLSNNGLRFTNTIETTCSKS